MRFDYSKIKLCLMLYKIVNTIWIVNIFIKKVVLNMPYALLKLWLIEKKKIYFTDNEHYSDKTFSM